MDADVQVVNSKVKLPEKGLKTTFGFHEGRATDGAQRRWQEADVNNKIPG